MKRYLFLIFALFFFCFPSFSTHISFADDGIAGEKVYIYDEEGNFLLEKSGVEIGDEFLDKNFTEWYIFKIENNV